MKSSRAGAQPPSLLTTAKVRLFFNPTTKKFNDMKKFVKVILAVACFSGIILAGCEEPDGSCNLIWTLSWLAVAVASGFGLKKMEEAK